MSLRAMAMSCSITGTTFSGAAGVPVGGDVLAVHDDHRHAVHLVGAHELRGARELRLHGEGLLHRLVLRRVDALLGEPARAHLRVGEVHVVLVDRVEGLGVQGVELAHRLERVVEQPQLRPRAAADAGHALEDDVRGQLLRPGLEERARGGSSAGRRRRRTRSPRPCRRLRWPAGGKGGCIPAPAGAGRTRCRRRGPGWRRRRRGCGAGTCKDSVSGSWLRRCG